MLKGVELLERRGDGHFYLVARVLNNPGTQQSWENMARTKPERYAVRYIDENMPQFDWPAHERELMQVADDTLNKEAYAKGQQLAQQLAAVFVVQPGADATLAAVDLGWTYGLSAGYHDEQARQYAVGFAKGLQGTSPKSISAPDLPGA